MIINQHSDFTKWLQGLRDVVGKRAILARLVKLQADDHFGDSKALGDGLNEMRVHAGPGYRIYYTFDADGTVILRGGVKDDQDRDIGKARDMIKDDP